MARLPIDRRPAELQLGLTVIALLLLFCTLSGHANHATPSVRLSSSLLTRIRRSLSQSTISTKSSIRSGRSIHPKRRSLLRSALETLISNKSLPISSDYGPNSHRLLGRPLNLQSLTRVPLQYFHRHAHDLPIIEDEPNVAPAACAGSPCPSFQPCGHGFSSSLSACWNDDYVDPNNEPGSVAAQRKDLFFSQKAHHGNRQDWCLEGWSGEAGQMLRAGCAVFPPKDGVEVEMREMRPWMRKWAGQVFLLENVFVNWRGQVFNETHLFDPSGCNDGEPVEYPPETHISNHRNVVNLLSDVADPHAEVFHELTQLLPMLLPLTKVLPLLTDAVIVARNRKLLTSVANRVLGLPITGHAVRGVRAGDPHIWFVRKLYQPVYQHCHHPSMSLWSAFRQQHLLPRGAPRLFQVSATSAAADLPAQLLTGVQPDWVVVVSNEVATRVHESGAIHKALLHYFPKDRIVLYKSNLDILRVKDLFNRAVLFITTSAPSLTHLMFMPTNATVLELCPAAAAAAADPTASNADAAAAAAADSDAETNLESTDFFLPARKLAEACGVRHNLLLCAADVDLQMKKATVGRDAPAGPPPPHSLLSCNMRHVTDTVDRVAQEVFTSKAVTLATVHAVTGRAAAEAERSGLAGWLMGTKLATRGAVREYTQWMECVAKQGRWEYNATPRVLPWVYEGFFNLCDHRWEDLERAEREALQARPAGGGGGEAANEAAVVRRLVGKAADDYALSGGPPDGWTVRDSLKYEWRVPGGVCPMQVEGSSWQPFHPGGFCQSLRQKKTIMFLGDSLTEQLFDSFIDQMLRDIPKPAGWAVDVTRPQFCEDWVNDVTVKHKYCHRHFFNGTVCPGLTAYYVRSDRLWLDAPRDFSHLGFTRMPEVKEADVIMINRGAHPTANDVFERELWNTVLYLRNRFPEKMIIYRNSPPGHADCANATGPLKERQDVRGLPFNWGELWRQNDMAKEMARLMGIVYMDVDTMTALRVDGHKEWKPDIKKMDCLHYCTPGPVSMWVEELYNILLRTL